MSGMERGEGLFERLEGGLRMSSMGGFDNDETFNRWALEIHEAQAASDPRLGAFWGSRGALVVDHWTDVPPVPTSAFKATPFGPGEGAEAVFRTSGTTGDQTGGATRGEHRLASLALYRAAAQAKYRHHLLNESTRVLSLIPTVLDAPDSSLARMVGFIAEEPEVSSTTWAFRPDRGVDVNKCESALDGPGPLLILTTAFALVQLLDAIPASGRKLAPGSGVMETGGFKGKAKEVSRSDLYQRVEEQLGLPTDSVVGEYGMTELLSQSYDGVMGSAAPLADRVHRFPPWVRTQVLDPMTLTPVPVGQRGLLAHYDLANAGSVCHILTEDTGVEVEEGGFRLLGRATGAEARGCSLIAEEFLARVRAPR